MIKSKTGNCLRGLGNVKKEPLSDLLYYDINSPKRCPYFLISGGSFFTIPYPRVFHGLDLIILEAVGFSKKPILLRVVKFLVFRLDFFTGAPLPCRQHNCSKYDNTTQDSS